MNTKVFDCNFEKLEALFGKKLTHSRRERLMEIFLRTEESWAKNLERFEDFEVQNILIAEAPPWSENGKPRYFYNQIESNYHKRIWRTFYGFEDIPDAQETAYNKLAKKNFLLIDSMPFAMNYSSCQRRNELYYNIVQSSLEWWTEKLNNNRIRLAENLNIAFGFKLNALAIIKATNGVLKLRSKKFVCLSEEHIAADGSGYTNSEALKKIFNRSLE